ncbi:MAG: GtrA family protein [Chloroflexota bacterium]|nr:GtrA family protein [Chloroflexota bacterium]
MKSFSAEALRFLLVGAFNTAATYLLYLAALQVMPYRLAYTGAYAAGIVLSYALNTWFVFRAPWSWKRLMAYPLVYLLQYGLGLLFLSLLVERGWVSQELAPLAVVVITLPLTFLATRYLIKGKNP